MRATGFTIAMSLVAIVGFAGCGGSQKSDSTEKGQAITFYANGDFQGAFDYCRDMETKDTSSADVKEEVRTCFAVRAAIHMLREDMESARQEIRRGCEMASALEMDKVGTAGVTMWLFLSVKMSNSGQVPDATINQIVDIYLMECGISDAQLAEVLKQLVEKLNQG